MHRTFSYLEFFAVCRTVALLSIIISQQNPPAKPVFTMYAGGHIPGIRLHTDFPSYIRSFRLNTFWNTSTLYIILLFFDIGSVNPFYPV